MITNCSAKIVFRPSPFAHSTLIRNSFHCHSAGYLRMCKIYSAVCQSQVVSNQRVYIHVRQQTTVSPKDIPTSFSCLTPGRTHTRMHSTLSPPSVEHDHTQSVLGQHFTACPPKILHNTAIIVIQVILVLLSLSLLFV